MKEDVPRIYVVIREDPNSSDMFEIMSAHGTEKLTELAIKLYIETDLEDQNDGPYGKFWREPFKLQYNQLYPKHGLDLENDEHLLIAVADVEYSFRSVTLELETL